MSDDNSEKVKNDLSNALLTSLDGVSPIFDAADGMKVDLERRGWSPTVAEALAAQWLAGVMGKVWT